MRVLGLAASILVAACTSSSTGPAPGVARSTLLVLPMTAAGTAVTPLDQLITFQNNSLADLKVTFNDGGHTLFADFTFPPHSVPFRNDTTLADTSTISVTVSVNPGTFEFTVGPPSLGFNTAGGPTVSVSYAAYDSLDVFSQSSRYANSSAYSQALALWFEKTADHWIEGRNSGHSGVDTVSSGLDAPGHYFLAAPK